LIAARVTGRGASGLPEIEAGLLSIPELVRGTVASQLLAHRKHYRLEYPDSSDTEFFKEMAPFFHDAWMSCLLDPPVPHLMNANGEDVLITRIRFDVTDPAALEAALDSATELEREPEKSVWRWLSANSKGQPAVLGSIVMEGEALELECMSAHRRPMPRGDRKAGGRDGPSSLHYARKRGDESSRRTARERRAEKAGREDTRSSSARSARGAG